MLAQSMFTAFLTAITPPRFDFDGLALLTGMTMPAFVAVVIALFMVVDRLQQRRTAVEAAAEALWQQRHTERLSLEAATQYETLPLSTS